MAKDTSESCFLIWLVHFLTNCNFLQAKIGLKKSSTLHSPKTLSIIHRMQLFNDNLSALQTKGILGEVPENNPVQMVSYQFFLCGNCFNLSFREEQLPCIKGLSLRNKHLVQIVPGTYRNQKVPVSK
jgi:hypothetical protein